MAKADAAQRGTWDDVDYSPFRYVFHDERLKTPQKAVVLDWVGALLSGDGAKAVAGMRGFKAGPGREPENARPVFAFLSHVTEAAVGNTEGARSALSRLSERDGTPETALCDIVAILAEDDRPEAAVRFAEAVGGGRPSDPAAAVNLFMARVESGGGQKQAADAVGTALAALTPEAQPPRSRIQALVGLAGALAHIVAHWRENRVRFGGRLTLLDDFLRALTVGDAMISVHRDVLIDMMLTQANPWLGALLPALERHPASREDTSNTLATFLAVARFLRYQPVSDDALKHAADRLGGYLLPLCYCIHLAEQGREEEERVYLTPLMRKQEFRWISNRLPAGIMVTTYFATLLHRLDARADANRIAAEVRADLDGLFQDHATGLEENRAALDTAVADGAHSRPDDFDPYLLTDWAEGHWRRYRFEFENMTARQNVSTSINALYETLARRFLTETPDAAALFNFGAFCGHFDFAMAKDFPDRRFFGFDRCAPAIALSAAAYTGANIAFHHDAFERRLEQAVAAGPTMLAHVRTCSMLYPAGVQALYDTCAGAGVRWILGVEGAGYSFAEMRFTDPWDAARPPVTPMGIMVDHPYPAYLERAGYRIRDRGVAPYPIPIRTRALQNLYAKNWFVAERIG